MPRYKGRTDSKVVWWFDSEGAIEPATFESRNQYRIAKSTCDDADQIADCCAKNNIVGLAHHAGEDAVDCPNRPFAKNLRFIMEV